MLLVKRVRVRVTPRRFCAHVPYTNKRYIQVSLAFRELSAGQLMWCRISRFKIAVITMAELLKVTISRKVWEAHIVHDRPRAKQLALVGTGLGAVNKWFAKNGDMKLVGAVKLIFLESMMQVGTETSTHSGQRSVAVEFTSFRFAAGRRVESLPG